MSCITVSHRRGLTGPELLVANAIIAILIGLLLPAVQRLDGAANALDDAGFKAIAEAIHGYDAAIVDTHEALLSLLRNARGTGQINTDELKRHQADLSNAATGLADVLDHLDRALEDAGPRNRALLVRAKAATRQTIHGIGRVNALIGLLLPAVQQPRSGRASVGSLPHDPPMVHGAFIVALSEEWQHLQDTAGDWTRRAAAVLDVSL